MNEIFALPEGKGKNRYINAAYFEGMRAVFIMKVMKCHAQTTDF